MARKDKTVDSFVGELTESAGVRAFESMTHHCVRIRGACKSPIEEYLGCAMYYSLLHDIGMASWDPDIVWLAAGAYEWPHVLCPIDGVIARQQARVGAYTVDFLFQVQRLRDNYNKFLVVECDGHDFHERTKEQAAHDRRRDRWMVENGLTVLRFTGSEIYRDALAAADQVTTILIDICDGGV